MTPRLNFCRQLLCIAGLSLALLFPAGCGTTPPAQTNATQQGKRPGDLTSDLLRVGDLVSVSFSGVSNPPADRHDERIKDDGHLTLPYIGEIEAAGKTRAQLQEDLRAAYVPKYYRHLTVVVASENRYFYVEGMVRNPGRYSFAGEMSVLKCIAAAGDFNDFARKSKVVVTRASGKKEHVDCVEAQTHSEKDLPIYPDDRIFVPRRYF